MARLWMHRESFAHCHEASINRYYSLGMHRNRSRGFWNDPEFCLPKKLTFRRFVSWRERRNGLVRTFSRIQSAACFRGASMEMLMLTEERGRDVMTMRDD